MDVCRMTQACHMIAFFRFEQLHTSGDSDPMLYIGALGYTGAQSLQSLSAFTNCVGMPKQQLHIIATMTDP